MPLSTTYGKLCGSVRRRKATFNAVFQSNLRISSCVNKYVHVRTIVVQQRSLRYVFIKDYLSTSIGAGPEVSSPPCKSFDPAGRS